jgi:hypothetical protein
MRHAAAHRLAQARLGVGFRTPDAAATRLATIPSSYRRHEAGQGRSVQTNSAGMLKRSVFRMVGSQAGLDHGRREPGPMT